MLMVFKKVNKLMIYSASKLLLLGNTYPVQHSKLKHKIDDMLGSIAREYRLLKGLNHN
jgi:hypothetical protein